MKKTNDTSTILKRLGIFTVIILFVYLASKQADNNSDSNEATSKSTYESKSNTSKAVSKGMLLPEVDKFLTEHKEFGTLIRVESVPNWAQGKRQQATVNINGKNRSLLFYTKNLKVVTVYEDSNDGRKKVWGEYQKSEKFTPVDRESSTSLPAYAVLYSNKMVSSRKFGDILIPFFSRQTPPAQRESTFRAIARKEGLDNASFYSINNAYKANVSASFAKSHPNAMRNGFLGMLQGGKFIAGETLYP